MSDVITLVTGQSGCGKTYVRCARFLVDDWLQRDLAGVHYSNFPIFTEKLESFAIAKGVPAGRVAERVRLIPHEVLQQWQAGKSGPWDYFKDADLSGCHIAIDEIHNFCGIQHSKEHRAKWSAFCGELRHRGATAEFLTQHVQKVAQEIKREAGIRYQLVNSRTRRDPWFGVRLSDWYSLRAKFLTKRYVERVWQIERRDVDGKEKVEESLSWALEPEYFEVYDSYSAPHAGGLAGKPLEPEWKRLGAFKLLAVVLLRNSFRMVPRMAVAFFIFWLIFLGGGSTVVDWLMVDSFKLAGVGQAKANSSAKKSPASGPVKGGGPVASKVKPRSASGSEGPASLSGPDGELDRLRQTLLLVQNDRAKLEQELLEQKKIAAEKSTLVLLAADFVVMRNGFVIRIGERIPNGPHAGKVVKAIDLARHFVILDDGKTLRLAGRRSDLESLRLLDDAAGEESGDGPAKVRPAVQRASGNPVGTAGTKPNQWKASDARRDRPAGGAVPAGGRDTGGSQRDRQPGTGRPGSDDRGNRPAGGSRPLDGGEASRGQSDAKRVPVLPRPAVGGGSGGVGAANAAADEDGID